MAGGGGWAAAAPHEPCLLQLTLMQYQLADDIPSPLPFRLFPTVDQDPTGRRVGGGGGGALP